MTVVLYTFLIFAAAGSRLAGYWQATNKATLAVFALGALALLYSAILSHLFHVLTHLPDAAKIVISVVLIAPLAICMGVPFPAGIMRLTDTNEQAIPWAWALNGFASVVEAVLAALLAIHLGFAAMILLAIMIYSVASITLRRFA